MRTDASNETMAATHHVVDERRRDKVQWRRAVAWERNGVLATVEEGSPSFVVQNGDEDAASAAPFSCPRTNAT